MYTTSLRLLFIASSLLLGVACGPLTAGSSDEATAAPPLVDNSEENNFNGEPNAPSEPPPRTVESSKTRQLNPQVDEDTFALAVESTWRLGVGLLPYHLERAPQTAYSPANLAITLGVAHAGARDQTRAALRRLLLPSIEQDAKVPAAMNKLSLELAKPSSLKLAQSVWINALTNLSPSYLDTLAEHYGLAVNLTQSPQQAAEAIQSWVKARDPANQAPSLTQDPIPQDRFGLVNAMAINLPWAATAAASEEAITFNELTGQQRTRPAFTLEAQLSTDTQGTLIAKLATQEDQLEVYLLSPAREQWSSWLKGLDRGRFEQLRMALNANDELISLNIPTTSFSVTLPQHEAIDALSGQGAFSSMVNFAGIDGQGRLSLSMLLQHVSVELSAQGLSAYDLNELPRSPPVDASDPRQVTIDRPFVFLVRDANTGALVLIGAVTGWP